MPLPDEWANVDWRPTVILLPDRTQGVRTLPLNRDKYPEHPRGYFMMATSDAQGPLIYYNAADVGEAGSLVSQFVFWHEMGHFHLGHITRVQGQLLEGVTPLLGGTGNRETDADLFACNYWIKQRSIHGIRVIESTIDYLRRQGNAPGDAEHPPPSQRCNLLTVYLDRTEWKVVMYNDNTTNPAFVLGALMDAFRMTPQAARAFSAKVEAEGSGSIECLGDVTPRQRALKLRPLSKTKAELLVMEVMLKAKLSGNFAFRIEALPL
jgi:hypothetical protein